MPTNLYGDGDNFDGENSHVVPALIKKFHQGMVKKSESVEVWGSGNALREFLYIDDLAKACVFFMNLKKEDFFKYLKPNNQLINIGTGDLVSINKLAKIIK